MDEDAKDDEPYHRANILAASIGRHPGPRPSDGEVGSLSDCLNFIADFFQ